MQREPPLSPPVGASKEVITSIRAILSILEKALAASCNSEESFYICVAWWQCYKIRYTYLLGLLLLQERRLRMTIYFCMVKSGPDSVIFSKPGHRLLFPSPELAVPAFFLKSVRCSGLLSSFHGGYGKLETLQNMRIPSTMLLPSSIRLSNIWTWQWNSSIWSLCCPLHNGKYCSNWVFPSKMFLWDYPAR